MLGRCIAYTDEGFICGAPARHIDIQKGGMVCDKHVSPPSLSRPQKGRKSETGGKKMDLTSSIYTIDPRRKGV
jgi:hypothetical protein